MPVIIDTTVWIDFFRGSDTPQVALLEKVVRRGDASLGDLILSEILQGVVHDRQFRTVIQHLSAFPIHSMVGHEIAVQSAKNYRKLRTRGFTVRKIVDCWIATFCIERDFALLHNDRDFAAFERYLGLKSIQEI